jgi:hypothetical protein
VQCTAGSVCRLATVNAPAIYIKPTPCWKADPSASALSHPIKKCEHFQYFFGTKTRGDCSEYGVDIDLTQCWIKVLYNPPDGSSTLSGWINIARTEAGPPSSGDVCGMATVNADGTSNIYVAMCTNAQCTTQGETSG